MNTHQHHTVIIGGGIIGVSTAYELARRGHRVTLIDRERFESNASTGNAGIIALGHPPMPRPGMMRRGLAMLLNPNSPFYVRPRLDWDLLRWLWDFRKACTERQFRHSMQVLAEMGSVAGAAFDRIVDDERLDCAYHREGWMEVFSTGRQFERGQREAELLRTYGYEADVMTGQDLVAHDPAFQPGLAGAVQYPESRFANPQRVLTQLADRAAAYGAEVVTDTPVRRILVESGRAIGAELEDGTSVRGDTVVLAAGIWSMDLARMIGVAIPMQAGKGYHVMHTPPEPRVSTACVLSEHYVAVNPACGGLRLAGTLEFSGINEKMMRRRLDLLSRSASRYVRGLDATQITSEWCGLRPCTADGLPVVGWAPQVEGLFIATGHAMMGFALGPATGQLACECILGEPLSIDIDALSPARFVGAAPVRHAIGSTRPVAISAEA